MTILQSGRNRMSFLLASTFTFGGVGTGTATASMGDTWLGTSVYVKGITVAAAINNVCSFHTLFNTSEGNSASSITEVILADTSTSIGSTKLLIRSVASTATWTSITKDTSKYVLVTLQITMSS